MIQSEAPLWVVTYARLWTASTATSNGCAPTGIVATTRGDPSALPSYTVAGPTADGANRPRPGSLLDQPPDARELACASDAVCGHVGVIARNARARDTSASTRTSALRPIPGRRSPLTSRRRASVSPPQRVAYTLRLWVVIGEEKLIDFFHDRIRDPRVMSRRNSTHGRLPRPAAQIIVSLESRCKLRQHSIMMSSTQLRGPRGAITISSDAKLSGKRWRLGDPSEGTALPSSFAALPQ